MAEPPEFFNAKLRQGTIWRGIDWPKPNDAKKAETFIDAYACLKLEMDRLKKHEDELDFFALELQSRRVWHGDWKPVTELTLLGHTISLPAKIPARYFALKPRLFGQPFFLPPLIIGGTTIRLFPPASGLAIALYGRLSNYGRSYLRPLAWLLAVAALGAVPFVWPGALSIKKLLASAPRTP
ncbi:MAG: hypothetical protein ACREC0_12315 [Methylocella sp.]